MGEPKSSGWGNLLLLHYHSFLPCRMAPARWMVVMHTLDDTYSLHVPDAAEDVQAFLWMMVRM